MARNNAFVQYIVEEVMQGIPGITFKGMFGGFGLYEDGIIFGLIVQDALYFKVDETNKSEYEKFDSQPFSYDTKKGKKVLTSYWEVPANVMEDSVILKKWIKTAVSVSLHKKHMQ